VLLLVVLLKWDATNNLGALLDRSREQQFKAHEELLEPVSPNAWY